MAKEVNKSEAVRAVFEKNPETRNKDVIAILAKRNIVVTPALVGNIKHGMKKNASNKRSSRQTVISTTQTEVAGLNQLLLAKNFVTEVGGFQNARSALDTLEQLSS